MPPFIQPASCDSNHDFVGNFGEIHHPKGVVTWHDCEVSIFDG